ncbi:hypothetical protein MAR621_02733 [Maribacter dokdonensis]|uniref:hypothetical protein n=1 Tax=Maribacter dokdonensis TaxID=320912 RepID=UPI001B2AC3E9|nr:hypothetical protein [Maribacter dokdonensis]CAG2532405.1 hypothetical protein MAR621_02733 [Maribacter dokdonensis]
MRTNKVVLTELSPEQLLMTSVSVFVIGGNYIANQFLSRFLTGTAYGMPFLLISLVLMLVLFGFSYHQIISKDSTIGVNNAMAFNRFKNFIVLIACYELVHVTISYIHLFLVKHYLGVIEAKVYASMALIGHFVYFVFWVVSVILISNVTENDRKFKITISKALKYSLYAVMVSSIIAMVCVLFSETLLNIVDFSPLLFQYVLGTLLFAISSVLTYYYLSLGKYLPVIISGVVGLSQIILLAFFHNSLVVIIQVYVIAMVALLVAQLLYVSHNLILKKVS